MRKLVLFLAIVFASVWFGYSQPKLPYQIKGACPFECCTYREWTVGKTTPILGQMKDSAKKVFTAKKGERVKGMTGVVVVSKPGRVRVLKNFKIEGEKKISFKAGDIIQTYNYLGEGFYNSWFTGKWFDLDMSDERVLKEESEAKSVWWVKIKNKKGQIGWTRHAENFGNMDACG